MNLEGTLNTISKLQSSRTNIFYIYVQEIIGSYFGSEVKTVLEGKYIRDIKENKDFNKYKSYHTEEIQFLSGKCYIFITEDDLWSVYGM